MTSLLESPVPALIVGILTTGVFLGGYLKTGWRSMIVGALVAIVATVGLVVLERVIVTERERVEQTLYDLAASVERNDGPAALAFVHSKATKIREHASRELSRWRFTRVVVKNNLVVELQENRSPPRAIASFNVVVVLSDSSETIVNQPIPRTVRVTFVKEGDDWRVWEYTHMDVLGNPDQHSLTVEE